MITTTVRKVIDETVEQDTKEHVLYMVNDKEVIFYVGRSVNPINRIHQHLAISNGTGRPHSRPSSLGIVIKDNLPDAYDWTVTFFSIEDFKMGEIPEHKKDFIIDELETVLIEHMKPCLNAMKRNYSNPLPDRYEKRKIANEGIRL